MRKGHWWILLVVIAFVISQISGCGSDEDKVVATVGDYDITLKEFNDYAGKTNRAYATAQEEYDAKRKVLDTMITDRLLIQAAYERHIDEVEEVSRVVLANREKFLLDILYQRNIVQKADVSEAEMKNYWNHLENKIRVSHIVVTDPDTAQWLVDSIMHGGNFEQLAYEYSIDPSAKRNRGDLGYVTWGALVDEFQDAAFQMEPGEISPPVKTQFGYHVIKVIDKQKNEARRPYDEMKASLKQTIKSRKVSKLVQEYMETLQNQFKVSIDTATVGFLMHKREQLYPPQVAAKLPRSSFDPEQLDRTEQQLVLGTWDGGQITIGQYLSLLNQVPEQMRPDLDDYDSLATVIFQLKINDLLLLQAAKQGLENDPEFKRKMRLYKELNMALVMKHDSLPQPLEPDEAEMRQYYDDHMELYTQSEQIHVYEILLSDEILANKLVKEIKTLEQFKEKATELTERPAKRGTNGDLGYIRRQYFPEVFDLAQKTNDGKIGGPVVTADGRYSIFWVVDRIPASAKNYLDVKSDVKSRIMGIKKTEALKAWVNDRKKETKISINEDAIWSTIDNAKYASAGNNETQATN